MSKKQIIPEVEESPRIYSTNELESFSNQDLVNFYRESKAIAESSSGDVWATALINQQRAEELIKKRAKKKGRAA